MKRPAAVWGCLWGLVIGGETGVDLQGKTFIVPGRRSSYVDRPGVGCPQIVINKTDRVTIVD